MVFEDDTFAVDIPIAARLFVNFIDAVLKKGDNQVQQQENREDNVDESHQRPGKKNRRHAVSVVVSVDVGLVFDRNELIVSFDKTLDATVDLS